MMWLVTLGAVVLVVILAVQLLRPDASRRHTAPTVAPANATFAPSNTASNTVGSAAPSGGLFAVGALPNASLTPGDVLTTDLSKICTPGYTQTVRDVPSGLKRAVYAEYGIPTHKPGEYEVDHLISLELGGSNSVRNLWPESYITKPLNAHVKDEIENKLHALVCDHQISIQDAQRMIATDWTAAYARYVGPLPH
jgi:hypothetical protein